MLLFARDANVACTNKRAQRNRHTPKVKQKLSRCLRKAAFAQPYYSLASPRQTTVNQGVNALLAFHRAYPLRPTPIWGEQCFRMYRHRRRSAGSTSSHCLSESSRQLAIGALMFLH